MKEFVISEAKAETAVLVGLITGQQDEAKTKEYLDELEFLATTAGARTVKRFTQKVNGPSSVTYVGTGKLEERQSKIFLVINMVQKKKKISQFALSLTIHVHLYSFLETREVLLQTA